MRLTFTACLVAAISLSQVCAAAFEPHVYETEEAAIRLSVLGQYQSGIYLQSASEMVTYDPATQRGFVINAASGEVDVLDLSNPATPVLAFAINVSDTEFGYQRSIKTPTLKGGVPRTKPAGAG